MYYATIKARRKNGRSHIKERLVLYLVIKYAKRLSYFKSKYIIEIYDERGNPVYKAESEDKE